MRVKLLKIRNLEGSLVCFNPKKIVCIVSEKSFVDQMITCLYLENNFKITVKESVEEMVDFIHYQTKPQNPNPDHFDD